MQPYHESPDDYYRFTLSGIKHKFREFNIIKSGSIPGSGFAIHWIMKEFKQIIDSNELISKKHYPSISRLFKESSLEKLGKEFQKLDEKCVRRYSGQFPDNFHRTACGVFVYCLKR